MPITTIDEWNQASFKEAFYECFSEQFGYNEHFRQGLFAYITKVLPGHKALACRWEKNLLNFFQIVFVSRNFTIQKEYKNYCKGINNFRAYAKGLVGDYSRQYSHSERAIGTCLFRGNFAIKASKLLIKNQSPTCRSCQIFLIGNALCARDYNIRHNKFYQIYFLSEKRYENLYNLEGSFAFFSNTLLESVNETIVSVHDKYEYSYVCK